MLEKWLQTYLGRKVEPTPPFLNHELLTPDGTPIEFQIATAFPNLLARISDVDLQELLKNLHLAEIADLVHSYDSSKWYPRVATLNLPFIFGESTFRVPHQRTLTFAKEWIARNGSEYPYWIELVTEQNIESNTQPDSNDQWAEYIRNTGIRSKAGAIAMRKAFEQHGSQPIRATRHVSRTATKLTEPLVIGKKVYYRKLTLDSTVAGGRLGNHLYLDLSTDPDKKGHTAHLTVRGNDQQNSNYVFRSS